MTTPLNMAYGHKGEEETSTDQIDPTDEGDESDNQAGPMGVGDGFDNRAGPSGIATPSPDSAIDTEQPEDPNNVAKQHANEGSDTKPHESHGSEAEQGAHKVDQGEQQTKQQKQTEPDANQRNEPEQGVNQGSEDERTARRVTFNLNTKLPTPEDPEDGGPSGYSVIYTPQPDNQESGANQQHGVKRRMTLTISRSFENVTTTTPYYFDLNPFESCRLLADSPQPSPPADATQPSPPREITFVRRWDNPVEQNENEHGRSNRIRNIRYASGLVALVVFLVGALAIIDFIKRSLKSLK